MWKRGGEIGRTEKHVDVLEIATPGGTAGHALVFAGNELAASVEWLAWLLVREKQPDVKPERLVLARRIDALGPAGDNCRAGATERIDGLLQHGDNLIRGACERMVEHNANAKIAQPRLARRRESP